MLMHEAFFIVSVLKLNLNKILYFIQLSFCHCQGRLFLFIASTGCYSRFISAEVVFIKDDRDLSLYFFFPGKPVDCQLLHRLDPPPPLHCCLVPLRPDAVPRGGGDDRGLQGQQLPQQGDLQEGGTHLDGAGHLGPLLPPLLELPRHPGGAPPDPRHQEPSLLHLPGPAAPSGIVVGGDDAGHVSLLSHRD